jgi:pimeloyl-ACP methyl ester carboxylesterase
VREWGEPGGRALLFWPGLNPWGSLQLVEVGPLLAARGFHVLSIEPPGTTGETPPLDDPDGYLPSRLARLVVEVAESRGIDRFLYMGHSWGGSIGVHLGASQPDRVDGIVLLDGGHVDVTPPLGLRRALVKRFEEEQAGFVFESWDDFLAWAETRVRSWRPALEQRYRAGMVERDGKVVARSTPRAAAWALHGVFREPPTKAFHRITVPVFLLVAADADPHVVARFRAAVPHAVVRPVDSGHDVPEDAPEELVAFVTEWLS